MKEHEIVDPFETGNAVATLEDYGLMLEAFDVAKFACFQDLDTGRYAILPDDSSVDPFNIDQVIDWARKHRFDLMVLRTELDGKPGSDYVLQPIGMEVWQNQPERFESIDEEAKQAQIELGTPVESYLAWQDRESGIHDPDRKATFLFRTSDGTCGAIWSCRK